MGVRWVPSDRRERLRARLLHLPRCFGAVSGRDVPCLAAACRAVLVLFGDFYSAVKRVSQRPFDRLGGHPTPISRTSDDCFVSHRGHALAACVPVNIRAPRRVGGYDVTAIIRTPPRSPITDGRADMPSAPHPRKTLAHSRSGTERVLVRGPDNSRM